MNITRPLTYTASIIRDALLVTTAGMLALLVAYVLWSLAFGLAQAL